MRLKKLEIIGFKSFADKTKLEFDPGITAVVGPNGCGKSNIADAFRWVMGEQSAKSMRGHKMPDVIFAGTTSRKPLNFAEVTITLTDIQGHLPVDYEEISITRRLHRSGESEYFINRHPVRLKDVQSLFLDSGMGKDAYSIFEQGEIDRVINLSPLERRNIFEEASGITRFLHRKREALRKLEQTDLNVSRVKDIHQEVEKQIIVLQEQAEKARQYKEDKRLLEELEKTLLVAKWDILTGKFNDAQQKAADHDKHINTANTQIESFQTQLQDAKQALIEADKALRVRGEEVFKVRSAKEIKSKEKQTNEERLKELVIKEKRWQHELESLAEKHQYRQGERKKLLASQKGLEKRFTEQEKDVKVQLEKVKQLEEELGKYREQHQVKQREWLKLLQAESQSESEIKQSSLRLESTQERQGRIELRKQQLTQAVEELQIQTEEKRKQLDEASRAVEGQRNLFSSMEIDLQSIANEMEKTQADIDKVYQELSEGKARQRALQRMRDDLEGFSAGSKRLLQEAADKNSPLFNKLKGLYEYFVPQKGSEAALAAVMRTYAQTLAVQTEEDFNLVVAFAKQNKIKDISLLCLETVAKLKKSPASKMPEGFVPLALNVLENELSNHFLNGVFVNKDSQSPLETVKKGTGFEIWMGDGAFVDRRSVIFYATQGENNVFLREAELKSLEKKMVACEAEKLKLDNIFQAIQQKRNQVQAERSELDKTIRRAEMRLVELNFAVQKATTDIEKQKHEERVLTTELQGVIKSINDLVKALENQRASHAKAKEIAHEAQKNTDELNEQLNKQALFVKEQLAQLKEKESVLQSLSDETKKQAHELHVLEVKDLESAEQAKRMEEEIEMGRALKDQIELKGTEVNKLLHEVEHALSDVMAACAELEEQVAARRNTVDVIESKINDKRVQLKKYENDRNQISIHSAQIESHYQSLQTDLQERYQLTIEEARKTCGTIEKSAEQIDRQIKSLRQQIEASGDINMTSIEECDKHKTRYEFLNQQIDDLNVSKQELVEIITQLDGESRKIFQETFEKISINFKKNFKVLFNGGEADLQFTESEDILEAGIEIIAKPPGKQMRSINLLSGGEKCLTAMALLFAIFEVKPAPFCILDEIDAPLDDTNVERFVNIVKLFVDRCQFIIITHNKRTMAIADVLFGVSMEERGVSKLLCMDFSKESAPELALNDASE